MKEKVQDVRSRNVVGKGFICSMENVVCVCAARLVVSKIVSKETKWSYEKVEMAGCVVGRARDCVRRSLAKAILPLEELNFRVSVSFVCLVERRALVSIKVAPR